LGKGVEGRLRLCERERGGEENGEGGMEERVEKYDKTAGAG